MGEEGKVVCVTGASGFIASWLVKLLLQRGYNVKASVRNPNDQRKIEHLLALDGAMERLHLSQADLLEEGSFDSIVAGCEGVFHIASPVLFSVTDPQAELIDPAVKGTINVLRSCAKVSSVKRVILTSSMAAVAYNRNMLIPGVVVDETWFSDPLFCEESKLWYQLSKTLAEEAAWKFANECGIDMITINPGWVIGPILQPTVNLTVEVVLNLLTGAESFPNATYRWTDVRDVANAHIQAFEIASASGRYCVVNKSAHFSEVVKILHELYPELDLPDKCDWHAFETKPPVASEKAKSLGIDFTPLEVSLKDTVESLKEKNFLLV